MDIQLFCIFARETLLLFCTSLSPQPEIIIDEMSRKEEGKKMRGEDKGRGQREKGGMMFDYFLIGHLMNAFSPKDCIDVQ